MLVPTTYLLDGDNKVNIYVHLLKVMPEIEALAHWVSNYLERPVDAAQIYSLVFLGVVAGKIKMVDGVWKGGFASPETVEALARYIESVSPTELALLLADPVFQQCKQEYEAWKAGGNHGEADQSEADHKVPPIPSTLASGLQTRPREQDTARLLDTGVELCIWFANIPTYEKLAKRVSRRLRQKLSYAKELNYAHAYFLLCSLRRREANGDNRVDWMRPPTDPAIADMIVDRIGKLGREFLDDMLADSQFAEWEREYRAVMRLGKKGTLPGREYQIMLYQMNISIQCSADDVELVIQGEHVPSWQFLARVLSKETGTTLNYAQACYVFMLSLQSGALESQDGMWQGCVYGPDTVRSLVEFMKVWKPEPPYLTLDDPSFKKIAEQYEASYGLS